jgi:3-hydroxy-9,10-secoandrosta-1,3,5(10)-triene-9,17-dione monooxygenase reductase component
MRDVNVIGGSTRGAPVDEAAMREVCKQFITGVAVVTSPAGEGPVGITVNSFTSVSLTPPLILFCIHQDSTVLPVIRAAGVFAVNILAEDQAELCRSFAKRATADFTGVAALTGTTGAPLLPEALAYLDCLVASEHRGGDHWIVVGEVVDIGVLRASGPLTFFRSAHPRLEVPA